ncbi:N,N'-diacetylchitobiose phosphorylase [Clostridium sp. 19966]|uniref:GH36-type glycosyl hydrolase domain-containing protein n=1 Tax=Clostridium sp. 19966 TaxID=2768166 RepID=UPI0028DEAD4A|nr:N,N'-diacetylchitobiose phosphorylase [Clostridium sp. 19966]MDT8717152.1 N,N'-diacetylchitobiose phosphorylase [Clostridium sp. 19966]
MNYGYFDGKNKEYVITKPNTPAPWANYLGSPEYGAIISNNAGGYSFVKSGANGRIIRYRFNSINMDQPGRYIYIRDNESKDYWTTSWQPVGKPLDKYKSECHHGTAYTNMIAQYSDIKTETLYYVPLDKTYEVWRLKLTNEGSKARKLSVTGYIEFTNDSNYEQDGVNLQYTQFITNTEFKENKIVQRINENVDKDSKGSNGKERFFAALGEKISAYNGDRDSFIGEYRNYSNPIDVENGKCSNTLNYNTNSCGALQMDIELNPGETREFVFLLGPGDGFAADGIIKNYDNFEKVEEELKELKAYWHGKLNNLQINTPDDNFNNMINTWNSYQCFMTFIWSRAASFTYCGLRNGYGYRDTVQDIQGVIHLAPEMALKQIIFMLSAQVDNGGGLPLVKYDHNAGHENTPDDADYVRETGHPSYRADDALWLFPTVEKYINESGNIAFLDKVIPFANKDQGSVYEHLKRAIKFSMERLGDHGMPAGLHADWNDCLRLGKKGESSFVAFQLYYAINILKPYAELKGDAEYLKYLEETQNKLFKAINEYCWEKDQFVRGIREDGVVVGSQKDEEASIWLNPQTWSVISGFADEKQAKLAMDKVYNILNTDHGAMLLYPPYKDHAFDGALMLLFNPYTKENGGIFSQSQGWLILAESLLGNGDRAFEYYNEFNPASMNDKAEIRKLEPYVHGQFVESKGSPYEGRAHVHWLTGTASTVMVGSVEGILGIKPQVKGIVIEPCIPSSWKGFTMHKVFRGKTLEIEVANENGSQKGVKKLFLNGEELQGKFIPEELLKENNEVKIIM